MPRANDIRIDRGTSATNGPADLAATGGVPATFAAAPAAATPFADPAPLAASQSAGSSEAAVPVFHEAAVVPAGSSGLTAIALFQSAVDPTSAPIVIQNLPPVDPDAAAALTAARLGSGTPPPAVEQHGTEDPVEIAPAADPAPSADASGAAIETAAQPALIEMREAVAAVQDTIAQLAARLDGILPDRVAAAPTDLADTLGALNGTVANLVEQADAIAAAPIELPELAPTLAAPAALVDGATAAVSDLVHTATGLIAGADPAAGISTLVGMVSAADAFGLHDTGNVVEDTLASALGSLGAVDLLADLVPSDALLGIGDHHGDHGGFGLGGLLDHG